MDFLIIFMEGIISFISPCMLPMLPIYISYFAGDADKKQKVLVRSLAFVLGFTVVFSLMGLLAGGAGSLLSRYRVYLNIVCGLIVIFFGLGYLDIIHLNFFKGINNVKRVSSVAGAFVFGMIYSVSLTPCVGAFLGSALSMAGASGTALKGFFLLLTYSLGLGVPFVISAVLIEQLGGAFKFIKKNYRVINIICGVFLIVVGASMMLGLLDRLLALFS
ncbi:MAG: cytochrome c biogenesis protein CcdA [Ruminococcaceae bacterium]|nr:cytochrome c biogenesis protein CcdA [Oscillospiraceae bacterium]